MRAISPAVTSRARSIVDEVRPEMEADGSDLEQAIERGRQHVLAGVLLHVLEPARPVDPAVHRPGLDLALDDVHDAAVFVIDDVDDARGAERAGIERLAT